MQYSNKFNITSPDYHIIPIYYYKYNNISFHSPKGIIQIIHRMSEQYKYYIDLIVFFTSHGFDIYIHDQRGHGTANKNINDLGFIAPAIGGKKIVNDAKLVTDFSLNDNPYTPLILFRHSFGSLIALHTNNYTKRVVKLIKKLKSANINNIQQFFYPKAKHRLYYRY